MKVECCKVHSGWLHHPFNDVVEIAVKAGDTEIMITAYPSDFGKVKIRVNDRHFQLLGLEFGPGRTDPEKAE